MRLGPSSLSLLLLLVLALSSFSLLSLSLEGGLGGDASEEIELGGAFTNLLDGALFGELLDEGTSNGSVDLELLHEGGAGDDQDFGDLGSHLVEALLFKEHVVVELVTNLNFGPGLLFSTFLLATGLLGGLRALGGGLSCIFTTLLLLGLRKNQQK